MNDAERCPECKGLADFDVKDGDEVNPWLPSWTARLDPRVDTDCHICNREANECASSVEKT